MIEVFLVLSPSSTCSLSYGTDEKTNYAKRQKRISLVQLPQITQPCAAQQYIRNIGHSHSALCPQLTYYSATPRLAQLPR